MTFLLLNTVEATLGIFLAPLVIIGWARVLRLDGPSARRHLLMAVIGFALAALCRMGWWDALRVTLGYFDLWGFVLPKRGALDGLINCWISGVTIGAELLALSALHRTIPEAERHRYTWLTAPWYPPRRRRP